MLDIVQIIGAYWYLQYLFRLISERTVEENILKKASQKRMLGDMAIEGGNFTTTFFKQVWLILNFFSLWNLESLD